MPFFSFSLFLVVFVCFPLYPICMFSVQILLKKEWNSNHFISFVFTDICILIFKTDISVRLESCLSSTKQTHAWHSINILFIFFGSSNISVFLLYFISLNVRMNDFIVVFLLFKNNDKYLCCGHCLDFISVVDLHIIGFCHFMS